MIIKNKPIKNLRKICQPGFSNPQRNWRDKAYQYISIYITKVFLNTPITANQVSCLMIFLGLVAIIFFMQGSYIYFLMGILIYHLSILLDWVDGEVARCKKICSLRGAYLDYFHHTIVTPLLIISLAIGAYRSNPLEIPRIIFLIAGFIGAYSFMIHGHLKLFKTFFGEKEVEYKNRKENKNKEEFSYLFRFDWPFNYILLFGIFNLLHYAVLIYAIFASLMLLHRIYFQFKTFK